MYSVHVQQRFILLFGPTWSFHFRTPISRIWERPLFCQIWELSCSTNQFSSTSTSTESRKKIIPVKPMSCITRCCPYSFWPSSLNNLSWFFRTLPPGWNSILQFLAEEKPPQFLEADPGWTWSRPQQTLSLLQVGTSSAKMLKQSETIALVVLQMFFKKQVSTSYLGRPWVMECTRAEVQWEALSPPQPTLSLLGATFKVSTSSFFQHGLAHNLSLNHYSGPGPDDLLFLQVSFLLI